MSQSADPNHFGGTAGILEMWTKLCDYKSVYPGSNKVVYGACEQESEEKNFKFWFFNMQN